MALNNITIGADPELFIINEKTGKVVSSIGLIPGVKGNPYRAEDMPDGFGLETDNILGEFNIPPCRTEEEFINNIQYMKEYINKFVKTVNSDYGILCKASMLVDEDQLQSDEAKQFFCDPDFNVYTGEANPTPRRAIDNLRSAGFHIHIGYDNPNIDASLVLIQYMDVFLGIPSVLKDSDTARRSLYGKSGSFRLTSYGCEYRVLSSYLLTNTDLLKWVWKQTIKAINAFNNSSPIPPSRYTQKIINNSDIDLAKKLIKDYFIE